MGKFIYNIDQDSCDTSVALGQMCFINCSDDSPACVDKTFTFDPAADGSDKVVFMGHHSSLSIGYDSSSTSLVCQSSLPVKDCPEFGGASGKKGGKKGEKYSKKGDSKKSAKKRLRA